MVIYTADVLHKRVESGGGGAGGATGQRLYKHRLTTVCLIVCGNTKKCFNFFLNSFIYTGRNLHDLYQMNASFHPVPVLVD